MTSGNNTASGATPYSGYRSRSRDQNESIEGLIQSQEASDYLPPLSFDHTHENNTGLSQSQRDRHYSVSSISSREPEEPARPDSSQQNYITPMQSRTYLTKQKGSQSSSDNYMRNRSIIGAILSLGKAWCLELFSTLFALFCLAAIASLLILHRDKPVPDRAEILSINSLISIFSSLYRASLVMPIAEGLGQLKWHWYDRSQRLSDLCVVDEASRGALGSLWLILQQVPRRNRMYFASFGALLTIATLAIDPFSQALVEHSVCRLPEGGGTAETARTNSYTAMPNWTRGLETAMDGPMHEAIYKGLMNYGDSASLINVDCESGNCTFGNRNDGGFFSSLALCHSCEDITSTVTQTLNDVDVPTFALPDSVNVTYYRNVLSAERVPNPDRPGAIDSGSFCTYQVLTLRLRPNFTDFWENMEPFAVRCNLDPCVKRYSSEVKAGSYIEFEELDQATLLLQQDRFDSSSHRPEVGYSFVSDSVRFDGEDKPCEPSLDRKPTFVRVDSSTKQLEPPWFFDNHMISYQVEDGVDWVYYPPECVWAVDKSSARAISDTLASLLYDQALWLWPGRIDDVSGPIWLTNLYAGGRSSFKKHDDLAKSLATSITAAMRNYPAGVAGGDRDDKVTKISKGMSFIVDTCIRVRWRWMIYLAALWILQLTFVLMVLCRIRLAVGRYSKAKMDWKCSPLPFLFHGLEESLYKKHRGVESAHDMETVAKSVTVKLEHGLGPGEWKFCEG